MQKVTPAMAGRPTHFSRQSGPAAAGGQRGWQVLPAPELSREMDCRPAVRPCAGVAAHLDRSGPGH